MKKREKIRDWIIHKLGGHTHLEYELIEKRMYIPAKMIAVRYDVERLKARMTVDRKKFYAPVEYFQRELAYRLMDNLLEKKYIRFVARDPESPDDNGEIQAELQVIPPYNRE